MGQWADSYINRIQNRETVQFRPHGNSMQPRIKSGQLVTVIPATNMELRENDVVLCSVDGKQYLHLIKKIGLDGKLQIGNNKGHINGWITRDKVYGLVTKVED